MHAWDNLAQLYVFFFWIIARLYVETNSAKRYQLEWEIGNATKEMIPFELFM